jgi:hypothetical protein
MDALDSKKNNVLHIALNTHNHDFIKKLVHIDSDYGTLRG